MQRYILQTKSHEYQTKTCGVFLKSKAQTYGKTLVTQLKYLNELSNLLMFIKIHIKCSCMLLLSMINGEVKIRKIRMHGNKQIFFGTHYYESVLDDCNREFFLIRYIFKDYLRSSFCPQKTSFWKAAMCLQLQ